MQFHYILAIKARIISPDDGSEPCCVCDPGFAVDNVRFQLIIHESIIEPHA